MRALSFLRDGHIMIFHVHVFPLFAGFPSVYIALFCLSSPSALRKHPLPWIFRSISFTCIHISPTRIFPPLLPSRVFGYAFAVLVTLAGFRCSYPPAARGAAVVGCRSRSYSRLSSPVSDGLAAQTKWRLVVSTLLKRGEGWRYSNIRREGKEGVGRLRRCSGMSGNRFCGLTVNHPTSKSTLGDNDDPPQTDTALSKNNNNNV